MRGDHDTRRLAAKVAEMLKVLAPLAQERDACERDIERALALMAATKKAAKHGTTKKAQDVYTQALLRLLAASRAYADAGSAHAQPDHVAALD